MAGSPVSRLTPPESKDTMALGPAFIFAWPACWPEAKLEAKLEVSPDEVPPRVFSGAEATAMRTAQRRAPSPCATMGTGMSSGRRRATAPLARRRTSGPSLCGTKPARRPSTSSAAARPSDMNKRVVRRFMGIPVGNGTAYACRRQTVVWQTSPRCRMAERMSEFRQPRIFHCPSCNSFANSPQSSHKPLYKKCTLIQKGRPLL